MIKSPTSLIPKPRFLSSNNNNNHNNLNPQTHFYTAKILEQYADIEPNRVTLRQLAMFGRHLTLEKLIKSANYLRSELPKRLAHRLRDFHTVLPFIAVANSHLRNVYSAYWSSFCFFRHYPEIKTLDQNDLFCESVKSQLEIHRSVIPSLAHGLLECYHRQVLSDTTVNKIMSEMLRSRIGRRVLAQQHLSLTKQYRAASSSNNLALIGILNTHTCPITCVNSACTISSALVSTAYPNTPLPEIKVVSQPNEHITFPFIPEHFEFMCLEIFKNAQVATLRHFPKHPPKSIDVTICAGPDQIVVRISDQGGSIPNNIFPYLFSFARPYVHPTLIHPSNDAILSNTQLKRLAETPYLTATTFEQNLQSSHSPLVLDNTNLSTSLPMPLEHLGLGAPLAKVYAEYWHGQIEVVNLDGFGTDVYIRVPRRGTSAENVSTSIAVDAQ